MENIKSRINTKVELIVKNIKFKSVPFTCVINIEAGRTIAKQEKFLSLYISHI